MAANQRGTKSGSGVSADTLRTVAAGMLPFYKAIAGSQAFAAKWSRAVVKADLKNMHKLLSFVAPYAARQGYGTNSIGYFISFVLPKPDGDYSNGTTIPPGTVQFTFQTHIHRQIAKAVIPFYRELAYNKPFAAALSRAISGNDGRAVSAMIRSLVRSTALKSVTIEQSGVALLFKYRSSKFYYRNLLFREFG
ncbi:hypothetical protein [Paenibacillus caui]|uniref:hypothetical protein n=1 Tax=Paenibacillus caui TaxID=2873927 RepID=UPI001CA93349|nr:hypothetical protein [Paenibacillus caui]